MAGKGFHGFFERYAAAALRKDVEAMLGLYADDLSAFDTWDAWSRDSDDWRTMNREWLTSLGEEKVVVTFDDIRTIEDNNIAMATAIVTFAAVAKEGKKLRSLQNRLTWVAARRGTGWKIVHQHTSVPVDGSRMQPLLHAFDGNSPPA